MEKKRKGVNVKRLLIAGGVAFLVFAIFPAAAQAATLYVSPSSGSHSVGSTFSVQLYVSSSEEAMNAASGTISFPQDKLELTSMSKSGSIMSLWVQEPSFSNSAGTATFEGIVLNPGFTGSAGKLISATFRVKAAGTASVAFAAGSVLANDGQGTNILTRMSGAEFSLRAAPAPEASTPGPQEPAATGAPLAPVVRSSTHPDSDKWYSSAEPSFSWAVPAQATAVRLLVGRRAAATPTVVYRPPIDSKQLDGLADGIWYFHAQLENSAGWGEIATYQFQVDTESPSRFTANLQEREDRTEPRLRFLLEAEDETSGIAGFQLFVDGKQAASWELGEEYTSPILAPGTHALAVRAVDLAGNTLERVFQTRIEALRPPLITDYPAKIKPGYSFRVAGDTAYAGATVILEAEREGNVMATVQGTADSTGMFALEFADGLQAGTYKLYAAVRDERGARSERTAAAPATVEVKGLSFLMMDFGALMFLVLFGLAWHWQRRRGRFKLSGDDMAQVEGVLHASLKLLKNRVHEEISRIDKVRSARELGAEKAEATKRLKKAVDDTESFVQKKLRDMRNRKRKRAS